jgi:hypothetical protein
MVAASLTFTVMTATAATAQSTCTADIEAPTAWTSPYAKYNRRVHDWISGDIAPRAPGTDRENCPAESHQVQWRNVTDSDNTPEWPGTDTCSLRQFKTIDDDLGRFVTVPYTVDGSPSLYSKIYSDGDASDEVHTLDSGCVHSDYMGSHPYASQLRVHGTPNDWIQRLHTQVGATTETVRVAMNTKFIDEYLPPNDIFDVRTRICTTEVIAATQHCGDWATFSGIKLNAGPSGV